MCQVSHVNDLTEKMFVFMTADEDDGVDDVDTCQLFICRSYFHFTVLLFLFGHKSRRTNYS